jgi:hypothetical protein
MDSCMKHPHEPGVGLCGRCGGSWCKDCLVYAFGPAKPPYCMECAMFAGGVRSSASRPALPKRELKKLMKAAKAEAKAAAKAGANVAEGGDDREDGDDTSTPEWETAGASAAVDGAAEVTTSWETPWWEDRPLSLTD